MKRRRLITERACVRLTLLLLAGAIVNVAVAWAIALTTDFTDKGDHFFRIFGEATVQGEIFRVGAAQLVSIQAYDSESHEYVNGRRLIPQAHTTLELPREAGQALVAFGCDFRTFERYDDTWSSNAILYAGWPRFALSCQFEERGDGTVFRTIGAAFTRPSSTFRYPRPAPIVPLWPGFAINTVFYAGMLWMLFAVPFVLRIRRRRRRGLCVKCGYDLRGSPPHSDACPECGATINARPICS